MLIGSLFSASWFHISASIPCDQRLTFVIKIEMKVSGVLTKYIFPYLIKGETCMY